MNSCVAIAQPAVRVPVTRVRSQAVPLQSLPPGSVVLNAVPEAGLVLNEHRQVIFANDLAVRLAGRRSRGEMMGRRLGEALACVRARQAAGGCGTGEACRRCAGSRAVASALAGEGDVQDWHLTRRHGHAEEHLDLRVRCAPLRHGASPLALMFLADQAGEGPSRVRQRVVLQNVVRVARSAEGILDSLHPLIPSEFRDAVALSSQAMRELRDEVQDHLALVIGDPPPGPGVSGPPEPADPGPLPAPLF